MKVPWQKHPSASLQQEQGTKANAMLVSLGALIPFPGTLLELVLSLCLQRDGVRGLLLSPASPCVAQAAPGVTGKEPAASSPHGPAGKVRSTTGAKSCSPSHSLHTAPSWDSLVHKSQQELWTCPGHICHCRGLLFPILVVSSPWCQGKGLLSLGTSARSSWQGLRGLSGFM